MFTKDYVIIIVFMQEKARMLARKNPGKITLLHHFNDNDISDIQMWRDDVAREVLLTLKQNMPLIMASKSAGTAYEDSLLCPYCIFSKNQGVRDICLGCTYSKRHGKCKHPSSDYQHIIESLGGPITKCLSFDELGILYGILHSHEKKGKKYMEKSMELKNDNPTNVNVEGLQIDDNMVMFESIPTNQYFLGCIDKRNNPRMIYLKYGRKTAINIQNPSESWNQVFDDTRIFSYLPIDKLSVLIRR